MSDFASGTKKIMLNDTKFVFIKSELSFEDVLFVTSNKEKGEAELLKGLFPLMIKDWNLEIEGKKADLNIENILKLKGEHVHIIANELQKIISGIIYDKKKQKTE